MTKVKKKEIAKLRNFNLNLRVHLVKDHELKAVKKIFKEWREDITRLDLKLPCFETVIDKFRDHYFPNLASLCVN